MEKVIESASGRVVYIVPLGDEIQVSVGGVSVSLTQLETLKLSQSLLEVCGAAQENSRFESEVPRPDDQG